MVEPADASGACKSNPPAASEAQHYVCAIDGRRKKPYTAADIDFFAIYVIPADSWYIIPIEESSSAIGSSPHNSLSQNACYKEAWHLLQRECTAWTGSVRTMQLRRTGVSALHAAEGTRATPPHGVRDFKVSQAPVGIPNNPRICHSAHNSGGR